MAELFIAAVIVINAIIILQVVKKKKKPPTVSSDGHQIPPDMDPTCAKYGHVHEETGHRYIVHEEPEQGYVILNGKKISLKDAARY